MKVFLLSYVLNCVLNDIHLGNYLIYNIGFVDRHLSQSSSVLFTLVFESRVVNSRFYSSTWIIRCFSSCSPDGDSDALKQINWESLQTQPVHLKRDVIAIKRYWILVQCDIDFASYSNFCWRDILKTEWPSISRKMIKRRKDASPFIQICFVSIKRKVVIMYTEPA